jgi:hypothetical protein
MNPTRLALYLAALAGVAVMGPRGPIYWDSFGYVGQAVSGQVGGLALGRPLFILVSHAIAVVYRAAGGSVWSLEPLLRTLWLAVAAFSAPLAHALARRCGLSERAAILAGLTLALSPAMAHTSDAVLTDGPAVAVMLLAFVLAADAVGAETPQGQLGYAAGAGAVLGVAFGLREQAVAQLVVLALMIPVAPRGARARIAVAFVLAFVLVAAAPIAYVLATQRGYVRTIVKWVAAMRRERAHNPYGVRDALFYLGWLASLGPLPFVAAVVAWARDRRDLATRWTLALAVTVPALVQLALLGGYQDIAYSPRYLLAALPGAVAIPGALVLDRWIAASRARATAVLAALVIPIAVSGPLVRAYERPMRRTLDALPRDLANLRPDSTIVTGQPCPAVELAQRLARAEPSSWHAPRPSWQWVCPGWSWPSDLDARLDRALGEGSLLVLDLRRSSWLGPGQRATRDRVEQYAGARREAQQRGAIVLWR